MGLFDSIFGGSSNKQKAKTTTNQNVKSTAVSSKAGASSTQTGSTGAQTGTSATQQQQTQVNLAPEVQALIAGLIGQTAGSPASGGTGDEAKGIAETLLARAGGTQDFVDQRKASILTAAEKEGQKQIDATTTANQRAAGSGFNTLVQAANQEAQNDLLIDLAGLEGQMDLAGREAETAALAQAFDAFTKSGELGAGAGLENVRVVSDLVNALKGATSTTTGEASTQTAATQEQQTTENTIQQLLEMITQTQKGKTVTSGETETDQGGSFNLIDLMPLLLE